MMKKVRDGEVKPLSEKILGVFIHLMLLALAMCCLYPFLVILGSSFQSDGEIMHRGYAMIPKLPSMDAYRIIFAMPGRILNAYKTTIITTVVGTGTGLWCVSSCGYVMSRKDFAYKRILSFYVFFTMLFNGGLVPTYLLISK